MMEPIEIVIGKTNGIDPGPWAWWVGYGDDETADGEGLCATLDEALKCVTAEIEKRRTQS